jgi:hypothetical protein
MYLVCIYLYVPGPCRVRGACTGVYHVCVCVCVCVCVSFNYFALVLSLCCSTGVRVGVLGSESTLYMVYFISDNGNIGGWNPLWKIIGGILSG